jgi:hypothetical protein
MIEHLVLGVLCAILIGILCEGRLKYVATLVADVILLSGIAFLVLGIASLSWHDGAAFARVLGL